MELLLDRSCVFVDKTINGERSLSPQAISGSVSAEWLPAFKVSILLPDIMHWHSQVTCMACMFSVLILAFIAGVTLTPPGHRPVGWH